MSSWICAPTTSGLRRGDLGDRLAHVEGVRAAGVGPGGLGAAVHLPQLRARVVAVLGGDAVAAGGEHDAVARVVEREEGVGELPEVGVLDGVGVARLAGGQRQVPVGEVDQVTGHLGRRRGGPQRTAGGVRVVARAVLLAVVPFVHHRRMPRSRAVVGAVGVVGVGVATPAVRPAVLVPRLVDRRGHAGVVGALAVGRPRGARAVRRASVGDHARGRRGGVPGGRVVSGGGGAVGRRVGGGPVGRLRACPARRVLHVRAGGQRTGGGAGVVREPIEPCRRRQVGRHHQCGDDGMAAQPGKPESHPLFLSRSDPRGGRCPARTQKTLTKRARETAARRVDSRA